MLYKLFDLLWELRHMKGCFSSSMRPLGMQKEVSVNIHEILQISLFIHVSHWSSCPFRTFSPSNMQQHLSIKSIIFIYIALKWNQVMSYGLRLDFIHEWNHRLTHRPERRASGRSVFIPWSTCAQPSKERQEWHGMVQNTVATCRIMSLHRCVDVFGMSFVIVWWLLSEFRHPPRPAPQRSYALSPHEEHRDHKVRYPMTQWYPQSHHILAKQSQQSLSLYIRIQSE